MQFDLAQLHDAMRAFIKDSGLAVRPWEDASKVGNGTLRKFLKNPDQSLSERNYQKLAKGATTLLKRPVSVEELKGNRYENDTATNGNSMSQSDHNEVTHAKPVVTVSQPLIVFRSEGTPDQGGSTLIFQQKVGEMTRVERYKFAQKAFCIAATDDLMRPAFRALDILIIDPDRPWTHDEDCLFVKDPGADPMETVARHLVRSTHDKWVVCTHTDTTEYELSRAEFPKAWPIISKNRP